MSQSITKEVRKYHLDMTLNTLKTLKKPAGDTRRYLDLDDIEKDLLIELIEKELKMNITERVAKAIFNTFQEQHPDGKGMKNYDDVNENGKEFARKLAKATFKTLQDYRFNNGDRATLEAIEENVE